jgi:phi13 family phage major tail protein
MGRIRYGLSNLHYAVATEAAGGALTYDEPAAIPGAKSMAFSPAGTSFTESADNTSWYTLNTNDGYTGTITFEDTAAADAFLLEVLGQKADNKGFTVEKANDEPKEFALAGQFELAGGTEVGKRVWFLRCVASRPDINGNTKEVGSMAVDTNTVNITIMPRISDNSVKYQSTSDQSAYGAWFTAVPTETTTQ